MKRLTSTFMLFLLVLLHSFEVHSQTILTIDYIDHFQQNESNIAFSKQILPKLLRSNDYNSIPFNISFGENVPDSVSKSVEVAVDIWRSCLNMNSDYEIRIDVEWTGLPDDVDVKTSVSYSSYNGSLYPTSLINSLTNSKTLGESPDAIITINKNKNWYCGYNVDTNLNSNSLLQAMLRSVANALGFGSSLKQVRDVVRFSNRYPSIFDKLLESSNGSYLKNYSATGINRNDYLLRFATGKFGDVFISGMNTNVNDSTYKMYTPSEFDGYKSLKYLDNHHSLMHYRLDNSCRILQVDSVTVNVLNKLGWDVRTQKAIDFSIVGDNISENGITSAYTSHTFHIEGYGSENITNGKWTFILPSNDGNDIVVQQSEGNLSFQIEAVNNPDLYRINVNGDIYGRIVFTGIINGKSIKILYNLTLELKPKISSVEFTRCNNEGNASYNVNCKVDYKGAESLYVSLEEEYSSLLRTQFVREPFFAHFSCNNISPNYYAWIDIKAENEYGYDTYTVELSPVSQSINTIMGNMTSIIKTKASFDYIKVYNAGGLYLKTVKSLGETINMPSGIYILNFYNDNKLVKSSKLLK